MSGLSPHDWFTLHLAATACAPYITTMFIETETTPNPASLKFLPGREVMSGGTREFATPEAAEALSLIHI